MSRFILTTIISLVFLFGSAISYSHAVCVIPNVDTPENTGDSPRVFDWCNNSEHYNNLWKGLHLNEHRDHWLEQFNLDGQNYCNPLGGVARLFNAAWFLGEIYGYGTSTTNWLAHVFEKSAEGYSYTCNRKQSGTSQAVATNNEPGRTWLRPLFTESSVPFRAATLAHEATHEDVSHIPQWLLDAYPHLQAICGTSVDLAYPAYNSNTTTIQVLHAAIDTYIKDASNQLLIRESIIRYPGQDVSLCSYIPLLSKLLFDQSLEKIKFKLNCFILNPYIGSFDGFTYGSSTWFCEEICHSSDYLLGGAGSCNEEYQPGNQQINQYNYNLCTALNDSVSSGASETERKAKRDEFNRSKLQCIPGVTDEYLEGYCSDRITIAGSVNDLETLWTIDDEPGIWIPDSVFNECARHFCEDKFNPAWITQARNACYEWSDNDVGCLDYLCGSLSSFDPESKDYFESVQCRRHYIEHNGNSEAYFDRQENIGNCENVYEECINNIAMEKWLQAKMNNTCSFLESDDAGSSAYQIHTLNYLYSIDFDVTYDYLLECTSCELRACEARLQLCESMREFNSRILSQFIAISEIPEKILLKVNPLDPLAINFDLNMKQQANYAASPTDNFTGFTRRDALHNLTYIPENIHALSKFLGKDAFFALYGSNGMEKLFGEETVTHFTNSELQFDFSLSPAQQQLMPELIAHKATRERIESAEIQDILELVAEADNELLFNFMADISQAENVDEINLLLDSLISILQ